MPRNQAEFITGDKCRSLGFLTGRKPRTSDWEIVPALDKSVEEGSLPPKRGASLSEGSPRRPGPPSPEPGVIRPPLASALVPAPRPGLPAPLPSHFTFPK